MRVAFLTTLSDSGGYGRFSRDLILHVARQGVDPVILASEDSPDLLDGIPVVRCLPSLQNDLLGAMREARQVWRSYLSACGRLVGVDVLHCLVEPYIPAAGLLAFRRRLIVSGVGSYLVEPLQDSDAVSPIARYLFTSALRRAHKIVCISRYTRSRLLVAMPGLKHVDVVSPGVDADRFASCCAGERDRMLLSVGALKPRKGYEYSIQAFAEAARNIRGAVYLIVGRGGSGGYRERLRTLISRCDMNGRVHVLSDVTDDALRSLYERACCHVLASVNVKGRFEGFGLVHLEAAAAGLPSIGSLDCGAEDAIIDGVTGFLVPQRDIQKLSCAMLRLLLDPVLAREMGEGARRHAAKQSWPDVARRMVALYSRS